MRIGYVIEHCLIELHFFRFRFGFLVVVVKKLLLFLCEWHLAWGPFATLLYSLSYGGFSSFSVFFFVLFFFLNIQIQINTSNVVGFYFMLFFYRSLHIDSDCVECVFHTLIMYLFCMSLSVYVCVCV